MCPKKRLVENWLSGPFTVLVRSKRGFGGCYDILGRLRLPVETVPEQVCVFRELQFCFWPSLHSQWRPSDEQCKSSDDLIVCDWRRNFGQKQYYDLRRTWRCSETVSTSRPGHSKGVTTSTRGHIGDWHSRRHWKMTHSHIGNSYPCTYWNVIPTQTVGNDTPDETQTWHTYMPSMTQAHST